MSEKPTCSSCLFWSPNQREVEQVDGGKYECYNRTLEGLKTHGDFGCLEHMSEIDTAYNVPNHTPNGTMDAPNPNKIDGPCEVLIVTYWKDFPWLEYTLRSMKRWLSGFSGITVAIPTRDLNIFYGMWGGNAALPSVRVHAYDEVPGKGMVQHMVKMAEADLIVPPGTKYVLHTDADGIFKMATTPEHYFWNDKPYYLIRTWASLGVHDPRHPVSKAVSDCAQWKGPTDIQLGWDTEWYTMCLNTQVFPIDFYKQYRDHIAAIHKRPFEDHMLAGRNDWPQTSMDYTAMGSYAHRFMNERFCWFNVENPAENPHPVDRKKAYWSHGGFSPAIREEIEGFLR